MSVNFEKKCVTVMLMFACTTLACKEVWYNRCVKNDDCCSKYCDKPSNHQYGVCKPDSMRNKGQSEDGPCRENYYNMCKKNEQCCSGFCDNPNGWEFGICKDKPASSTESGTSNNIDADLSEKCHDLEYNKCKKNEECCSGFCYNPGFWEYGVCSRPKQATAYDTTCKSVYYNECEKDDECCSKYCNKGPENTWRFGICKNETTRFNEGLSGNGTCHKIWYNGCTGNTTCCSGYCFLGDAGNWEHGVCKWPDLRKDKIELAKENETNICRPLYYDQCENDLDCCSRYCYKKDDKQKGTCLKVQYIIEYKLKLNISKDCTKKIDEQCSNHNDCCSGICDKLALNSTTKGLCKPSQFTFVITTDAETPGQSNDTHHCTSIYTIGCKNDYDCCNEEAYCYLGPDKDWRVGECRHPPFLVRKDPITKKEETCYEDWYEYCLEDSKCCSGTCYRDPSWWFGMCLPNRGKSSNGNSNNNNNNRIGQRSIGNENPKRNRNRLQHRRISRKKRSIGGKMMVCYIGTWANYKPNDGKFTIEDIDAGLCTHLVYGFAKLEGFEIAAYDPWLDLSKDEPGGGLDAYARFNKLKEKNSEVKTIIAIGGWNEGSEKYSQMASTDAGRQAFTNSVVKFLKKHKFDGIDIDWEYPSTRGGQSYDKDNFSKLIASLSSALHSEGLLLSLAVSANPRTVETGYDVPFISSKVDFISIMSYDYHGAFDNITGHNAPLFGRPDDEDKTFNVNFGVKFWLLKGAPKEKLVMGMPVYGRTMTLKDKDQNGIGADIRGPGDKGVYSGEPGAIYYRELCVLAKDDKEWDTQWDSTSIVPYMRKGDQWITFDNVVSLKYKTMFVHKMGLAGAMIWSMESDDFQDNCKEGKNPLINAIVETLKNPFEFDKEKEDREKEEQKKKEEECPKSGIDSIPVLSQLKSLFQAIGNDAKCAKATQERFVRTAPIISQITSAVQAAGGDPEEAKKTQEMFLKNLEEQVDGTPILGHIKGGIHMAANDKERGEQIMKDATRPLATIGGGIAGFAAGGPVGAVAGGIAGGAAYDGLVTGIDSAVKGEYTAYGTIDSVPKVFKGEATPGEVFDTVAGVIGDGLSGVTAGKGGGLARKPKPGGKSPDVLCRRRRAGGSGGSCSTGKKSNDDGIVDGIFRHTFHNIPDYHKVPNVRWYDPNRIIPSPGLSGPVHVSNPRPNQASRQVQVNPAANNRVEYVKAHITKNNLKQGTDTTQVTRDYSNEMGTKDLKKFEKDDAGHIIASNLGGPGDQVNNIFPQTGFLNKGAWKGIEQELAKDVKNNGDRIFHVKLIYDDSNGQLGTRPTSVQYKIEDPADGRIIHFGDIENPVVAKGSKSSDY